MEGQEAQGRGLPGHPAQQHVQPAAGLMTVEASELALPMGDLQQQAAGLAAAAEAALAGGERLTRAPLSSSKK
jgi:hypothetical protein